MTKVKQSWLVVGIVLLALVLDQVSKVYIKLNLLDNLTLLTDNITDFFRVNLC